MFKELKRFLEYFFRSGNNKQVSLLLIIVIIFVRLSDALISCSNYFNELAFNFENPLTPTMVGIINMHDYIMLLLGIIVISKIIFFTATLNTSILSDKVGGYFIYDMGKPWEGKASLFFTHAPILEWIWTVVPALLLLLFASPSFVLLYSLDEIPDALYTISVIGNQWYWSYEYNDFNYKYFLQDMVCGTLGWGVGFKPELVYLLVSPHVISLLHSTYGDSSTTISFLKVVSVNKLIDIMKQMGEIPTVYIFDSLMVPEEQLPKGYPRLLTADQVLVIPSEIFLRFLVTSADVIHSWTIPNFGIKVDAVPGRLNQLNFITNFCGTSWGQCSELCGINHGFMPIEVRTIPHGIFVYFLETMCVKSLSFVSTYIR